MNGNPEDWNDTELLKEFHKAVSKHRTKSNENKQRITTTKEVNVSNSSTVEQVKETEFMPTMQNTKKRESLQNKRKRVGDLVGDYYSSQTRADLLETSVEEGFVAPSTKRVTFDTQPLDALNYDAVTNEASYTSSAQSLLPLPPISPAMVDDALQTMLMAWYQSGYATGRYQTLCELSGYSGTQQHPAPFSPESSNTASDFQQS